MNTRVEDILSRYAGDTIQQSLYRTMKEQLGRAELRSASLLSENEQLKLQLQTLQNQLASKDGYAQDMKLELETLSNQFVQFRIDAERQQKDMLQQIGNLNNSLQHKEDRINLLESEKKLANRALAREQANSIFLKENKTENEILINKRYNQIKAENDFLNHKHNEQRFAIEDYKYKKDEFQNGFLDKSARLAQGVDFNASMFSKLIGQNDAFTIDDLKLRQMQLE
ncbi:Hypothetical_protein [Hexamita inflata]|uniref:Hypothetical_protein n=1 Tax=Hexamita inflata TaxID=28002 RepID=A0AA86PFW8_9EUKA|nr:Hypothetical protein HINF_LOCUS22657 [Hexamita inflata]